MVFCQPPLLCISGTFLAQCAKPDTAPDTCAANYLRIFGVQIIFCRIKEIFKNRTIC